MGEQKLTLIKILKQRKDGRVLGKYLCNCGKICVKIRCRVNSNYTTSCGCGLKEKIRKLKTTHGKTFTPEYNSWYGMKRRCSNKNTADYRLYGALGIKVCPTWLNSFEQFLKDMGPKPDKTYSLDRIDSTKNYTKENCRWASPEQQSQNTNRNHYLNYNGVTMCISAWERHLGFKCGVIKHRINGLKWSIEKALTTPVKVRICKE
jgi:hypothetical protein